MWQTRKFIMHVGLYVEAWDGTVADHDPGNILRYGATEKICAPWQPFFEMACKINDNTENLRF